ncbi:MAG: TetR/AcrR family transcriptional regulator; helix-turn-helix transcriptional regulator [Actinobacteria bacterium]|nr:TetR/AcrR family transcriptional regulator; helix-turn-helix transcriptional regulator [Actinomycetota bacterium]
MPKRTYTLKLRAERRAETRRRITEAAVELHRALGPARTSLSAIAERAGVQRQTVYAHFPDEASLLDACTAHWMAGHPFPDVTRWAALGDPADRLRRTLADLYSFYAADEEMLVKSLRDAPEVPVLSELWAERQRRLTRLRNDLAREFGVGDAARSRLRAAIGHGLAFDTWRSLARGQRISNRAAAELMTRLAVCAVKR